MTTDNTQELDEILEQVAWYGSYKRSGDEPEGPILSPVEATQAINTLINKQTNEAIHGFHGFVMEADIIRPEVDQAFNYGRLHRAIDDYIAERNKLNNPDGGVK